MSNVIRFRGRVPLTAPPAADLVEQLAGVELELARTRLARLKLELRQARMLTTWWALKRLAFVGFLLWLLSTFAGAAEAGTFRNYYNANGGFEGSSVQSSGSRFRNFYDRNGRLVGTEVRRGRR
jgi:hypothetical protein